jgi:hypothetical protein
MPRTTFGRKRKLLSGSSCTTWRTPTKRGWFANAGELFGESLAAQVDPADDAFDETVFCGKPEQPAGFFERLPRLNRDTAIKRPPAKQRREVLWQKVAPQRPVASNPRILRRFVAPKMLMRIDPHHSTTTIALITPLSGCVY